MSRIVTGNGFPCIMIIFQCPDHTLYIITMNLFCGIRVNFLQHPVQIFIAFFLRQLFQKRSVNMAVIRRRKVDVIKNRLYIKSCPSYDDRNFSSALNVFYGLYRHIFKYVNIKFFCRFQHINQVMRYSCHFFFCNFCRTDIHSSVYLNRVGADNFPINPLCQRNGEAGFSNGCRSCQDH